MADYRNSKSDKLHATPENIISSVAFKTKLQLYPIASLPVQFVYYPALRAQFWGGKREIDLQKNNLMKMTDSYWIGGSLTCRKDSSVRKARLQIRSIPHACHLRLAWWSDGDKSI